MEKGSFRVISNQGQSFAYALERKNPLWKIIIIKQYLKQRGFPDGIVVKRRVFDPWVWQDPLEYELETHSNVLAWKIPWREPPGGLQSMGSQRVRHDWVTMLTYMHLKKNSELFQKYWEFLSTVLMGLIQESDIATEAYINKGEMQRRKEILFY